jgi:membrane protein YdbS with pleckstrin-like domain
MRKITNLQFSSPAADRRVMLRVSFALMVLLWLFCIAVLVLLGRAAYTGDVPREPRYVVAIVCSVLSVVLIPIQLVRYARQIRASR